MPKATANVKEHDEEPARDSQSKAPVKVVSTSSAYQLLFGRMRSKSMSYLSSVPVPKFARGTAYNMAGYLVGANLDEAERPLEEYRSFGDLFSRKLRTDSRHPKVIHKDALLCPVDGLLLNFFKIGNASLKTARVSQVKNTSYHVPTLVGEHLPDPRPGRSYFSCVLYLSPGDYHHFHAPCEMLVTHRTHFHGEMLPVAPIIAGNREDLFCTNERVCLCCTWAHGMLYYVAVAAYNVGDIRIVFDPELRTNIRQRVTRMLGASKPQQAEGDSDSDEAGAHTPIGHVPGWHINSFGSPVSEKFYCNYPRACIPEFDLTPVNVTPDNQPDPSIREHPQETVPQPSSSSTTSRPGIRRSSSIRTLEGPQRRPDYHTTKGGSVSVQSLARVGEFKLGSTVVLIFEAPDDFKFVHPFETRVRLGDLLGYTGNDLVSEHPYIFNAVPEVAMPQHSPSPPHMGESPSARLSPQRRCRSVSGETL